MINTKLLDELESHIRSKFGSIEEFLDSDCRNKELTNFYAAKFAILEEILDKLSDLQNLVDEYNNMEPSDYD